MKPRVVHISPAHPPTDPRLVRKQASTLADHYDVFCLVPNARQQGGPIRFISLPFFRWLGWRLLLVHPLIMGHIIRLRPAVLHIYMPELLPLALCTRLFGVKIIYEVQENLRLKFDRKPRNKHLIFRWAFAGFDQLARRYCYHIFTEVSYLITYTGLRLPHAVIHNYPDLAFFDACQRQTPVGRPVEEGPHLLYVGVVSLDRGLDTMIRVMARLRPCYPAIRLHLFGRCTIGAVDLQRLPNYSEVRDNLIFYGQTAPALAYANPAQYVAGLALLKPVGDYADSYPAKLFEYMALGLPVITADFPLYRAVVEPAGCGYCADPTDDAQVAAYITYLLANPAAAIRLGQRGQEATRQFYNWKTEADQLLGLYQKIVLT